MVKRDLNEEVKPNLYFNLADGRIIKSVPELLDALKNMEDWVFKHHVNSKKNDFSNWVRDVYKDKKLAIAIKKSKRKNTVIKKLHKELKKNFKKRKKQEAKEKKKAEKEQQEKEKQRKKQEKNQKQEDKKKEKQQEKKAEKEKSKVKKIKSPKKKKSILDLLKRLR
jgi:transcription-repair coupling factor (superfamily II helicase)